VQNKDKIILDLCGGTGAWSEPYKEAGYTVHVITLPKYSVADWWVVDGVLRFRKNTPRGDGMTFLEVPINQIYGILAAPPCTQFSIARTRAKLPRDFTGGMQTVQACLNIIWTVRANHLGLSADRPLKFWALENPVGLLRQFIGIPSFSFKQWEYGDGRDKPTDLWGYFNPPRKTVKTRPDIVGQRWGFEKHANGLDRAAIRAMTARGFAEAFYKANR
jgi:hypothetical protein